MQLMEPVLSAAEHRRKELADFIRSRRAEITTDMAGLPRTSRRRTPGLRREEVAELAGISTTLYSWLEQGRDVPISRRIVDAIAAALRLPPSERAHLHYLASHDSTELDENVSSMLRHMVGSIESHPIFVLDHAWDIVYRNRAADVVFPGGGALDERANLLEAIFTDADTEKLFEDWRAVAESVVELFRYDFAQYAEQHRPFALVEKLRAVDPRFAAIWDQHRIRRSPRAIRRLRHPLGGALDFEPSTYAVIESPGLRLMVFTPSSEETAARVKRLMEG